MSKEIWKDIPGFDGNYQASTLGRIRSVDREQMVTNPTKKNLYTRVQRGVILKIERDKNSFYYARLYHEGIKTRQLKHRLVAMTFLENPNNYQYVRFKDGNKSNSEVANLEWTNKKR